ncbi:MAG: rhodanese-like domain-containing protein [Rhodospirillum sp.]|nr:rhodanese-like domain-containing protein [Rhodospirillum sp.]MCF8490290.1 rhodanese-like domain-containing protein [Rhodospirillum sp.]MCF8499339.1 rhodanese-like domain-containing protein [Rhodospirillum sp.]
MNTDFNLSWGFLSTAFLVLATIFAIRMLPRLIARVPFVSLDELKGKVDAREDLLVIDVRSAGEYAGGHPRGAMNIPVGDIKTRLAEIPEEDLATLKATPVYLICATNSRAASAARALKGKGFSAVSVVDGGVGKWRRKGYPMG